MSLETADVGFMRRAIALARARVGLTAENPAVGCVVVREGRIVGEAATAPGGRPHAEEQALDAAGGLALGATAYVTLEPCGARSTGAASCSQRLVQAGVSRVVIACGDPSTFAAGQGTARLEEGGIKVETGLLVDEAAPLYAAYRPAGAPPLQG